mmetsp:Transcript_33248/g.80603  ORF Transcript_33248/g.80603 Transcript_33248/m.80603 type:complete len:102 (+) Transcript_33248:1245-1550(+)
MAEVAAIRWKGDCRLRTSEILALVWTVSSVELGTPFGKWDPFTLAEKQRELTEKRMLLQGIVAPGRIMMPLLHAKIITRDAMVTFETLVPFSSHVKSNRYQ